MAHYKTLKAWQHAQRLAIACVKAARAFPDYEQHALADQLRRACYSVPLNIAEGNTRQGSREYRRVLGTARGAPSGGGAIIQMGPAPGDMKAPPVGRPGAVVHQKGQNPYCFLSEGGGGGPRTSAS